MITVQLKENTRYKSNIRIVYNERRKIIIEFENGKYPLPKKYVPNKYSFNENEMDASEFLTRIKRGKQKMKILIQESTSCLKKKAKEKKTKSRRQKHAVDNFNTTTAEKEKSIENELFKRYFNYSTPSMMYNALSDTRNTERKFNQI